MVRRRRDEPLWPFAVVSGVLLAGVGVVVITRAVGAPEEAPVGEAVLDGGLAGDVSAEELPAEAVSAEAAPTGTAPAERARAQSDSGPRLPTPDDRIRVEVLNGGGVPGVAGTATDILRRKGFDVVYFGNESPFGRDSSVVIDRTGMEGAMEAISQDLGITASRAEPDSTRLVDFTVFLGTDWQPPLAVPVDTNTVGVEASDTGEDGSTVGRPWSWRNLLRLIEGVL